MGGKGGVGGRVVLQILFFFFFCFFKMLTSRTVSVWRKGTPIITHRILCDDSVTGEITPCSGAPMEVGSSAGGQVEGGEAKGSSVKIW
jgi:hypothetical protein